MPPTADDAIVDDAKQKHLEELKSMSGDQLQARVAMAKENEAAQAREEEAKRVAREKAIAEYTAAAKAAFAAGSYAEAERCFDRVLTCHPEKPAEVVFNRAACAFKMGRYADAESDAAEATYLEPSYVKAHYRLALAQQALGKLERAQKACRAALALEPSSPQLTALFAELTKAADAEQQPTDGVLV